VIIHKDTAASIFNYNPTNDLVRFKATPVKLAKPVETFTIDINDLRDESRHAQSHLGKTRVPMKLEVELVGKLCRNRSRDGRRRATSPITRRPCFT